MTSWKTIQLESGQIQRPEAPGPNGTVLVLRAI